MDRCRCKSGQTARLPPYAGKGKRVGREELGENYYGLIECAWFEARAIALWSGGGDRPSILWWLETLRRLRG